MSTIAKFLAKPPDNFSTQIASATVASNALSIQLDSVTGLPTEGVGQLFKKDANGELVAGSVEFVHWTNVSGSTITFSDTGDRGITGSDSGAQAYVADDYFEVWASSYYVGGYGGLIEHGADGTHDNTKVVMITGAQTVTGLKTFKPTSNFNVHGGIYNAGNSSTSITIDWRNGDRQYITTTGTFTITFSNASEGQSLTLYVIPDGSHTFTFTDTILWADNTTPTWTTTSGKMNGMVISYANSLYVGTGNKFGA